MRVCTRRPDERWLYGFLLGFGADLRVLQPPEAARKLRDEAEEILKLYPEPLQTVVSGTLL
jgi:predicted DNA-binding transcriptional regulator YafY